MLFIGLFDWIAVELNYYYPMDYSIKVMLKYATLLDLTSKHFQRWNKITRRNYSFLVSSVSQEVTHAEVASPGYLL